VIDPAVRLPASEAIGAIRRYAQEGVRILGVEGFEVVPDGIVAHIDLILDLSVIEMNAVEAASEAEDFVRATDRPNLIWEICADVQ